MDGLPKPGVDLSVVNRDDICLIVGVELRHVRLMTGGGGGEEKSVDTIVWALAGVVVRESFGASR